MVVPRLHPTRAVQAALAGRRRPGTTVTILVALAALAALASACSTPVSGAPDRTADPTGSVSPRPNYFNACAPAGLDDSLPCLQVTLEAVDRARADEGVGPMALPADFAQLSLPEQLFVAVDRERVDRGLPPFVALIAPLDTVDQEGADRAQLPPDAGPGYRDTATEWLGGIVNALDADYLWMYDDGPGAGLPHCSAAGGSGCWVDRHILLGRFPAGATIVMGAAVDPTGDRSAGDLGGPSLAATFTVATAPLLAATYTWAQAEQAQSAGVLRPFKQVPADESPTGILDPPHNVAPQPDYTRVCRPSGLDSSSPCIAAVLAAVDHARSEEGVGPMVLPTDFDTLTVPEQIFVAIDRERVDRGLAPFVGLVAPLDENAQRGADRANDPPATSPSYTLSDGEWAGGSANGLDAVYGWMYDDGPDSGNLDCPTRTSEGCWGHRKGILDDFGTGPDLVMGAAVNPTADTNAGDTGGTSMAATLAVTDQPPGPFVYTWAEALASTPAAPAQGTG